MRAFFKIFFASLFALVVFSLLVFLVVVAFIGNITSKDQPKVQANTVLTLDLNQSITEQEQTGLLSGLDDDDDKDIPGLYDIIRLLRKAKADKNISGLYIKASNNPNGFAASEEIRHAIKDFKSGGKFVIAYGDVMSQKAYSVANIADKIFVSPQGYFEWSGYSADLFFLKGMLDRLEIQPQIFYAGKFKSATEPLRMTEMSPENKLQTAIWLNDIYDDLLLRTAETRKIDTATLHQLANNASIQFVDDAVKNKLIDGAKYDDEVKDELKKKLSLGKFDKINFVSMSTYKKSGSYKDKTGSKMALIYAEGDIIDGKGDNGSIGSDNYQELIRKARLDRSIKAIIFRINSGGGSTLASENIWRELQLAKKEKPVIVSFGDVAASGAYYVSAGADSIFAMPTTITGSIGVFGIIPNMQDFFNHKLGITFDGVKTAPYANSGAIYKPLNENEKRLIQAQIDVIYTLFKNRVAEGRKKDTAFVESIAQGRVWTGMRAKEIGLIDRFGGIADAVRSAARKAGLNEYYVTEYPQKQSLIERVLGMKKENFDDEMKAQLGTENYMVFKQLQKIREITGHAQARLPFSFNTGK